MARGEKTEQRISKPPFLPRRHGAGPRLAIRQAEDRAASLAESDPVMALLKAAEVGRLRTALEVIVPSLAEPMPGRSDHTLDVM